MTRTLLIIVLLLAPTALFSQERQRLRGLIIPVGEEAGLAEVFVINSKAAAETKTDRDGFFEITAKPGDILTIYSTFTEVREFTVTDNAWKEYPLVLSVERKSIALEEVVIDHSITPESLGLVPEGQKTYTPAERKLRAAKRMVPEVSVGNMMVNGISAGNVAGIGLPTDAIINAVNGKTKQLKRELKLEKKEMLLEKTRNLNTEEEMKAYNIPPDYIQGFYFFLVEDSAFARALEANDDFLAKFLMGELAGVYLSTILPK